MFVALWDFRGLPRGRTMGIVFRFLFWPPWGMAGVVAGQSAHLLIPLRREWVGWLGRGRCQCPFQSLPSPTTLVQPNTQEHLSNIVMSSVPLPPALMCMHACMYVFLCECDYVHTTTIQHHTRRHVTHRCELKAVLHWYVRSMACVGGRCEQPA